MRDYEYEKAVIAHWGVPNMKRPHGLKYNVKKKRTDDIDNVQKNKIRAATATGRVIMRYTNNKARNQNDALDELRSTSVAEARKAKAVRDAQNARKAYLKKKYNVHREEKEELANRAAAERLKKASNPFPKKESNDVDVAKDLGDRVKEKKQKNLDNWSDTINKFKGQLAYAKMTDKGRQKATKAKKQESSKRGYENSVLSDLDKGARRRAANRDEKLQSGKFNDLGKIGQEKRSNAKQVKGQEMLDQMNPFMKKKKKKG